MGKSSPSASGSSSDDGCCDPDVFADENVRQVFLSKVYGLFGGHLLAALGIALAINESENFLSYMASHPHMIWASMLSPLVVLYLAYKLGECRRTCPLDYFFLALFTLSLGLSFGMITALTGAPWAGLLLAFLAADALNLALYSRLAKCDTSLHATSAFSLAVSALCVSVAVLHRPAWLRPALSMGALAFADSLWLVYIADTMVSPGYAYELCPEEYPFAALNVYVDVVRLVAAFVGAMGSDDGVNCDDNEEA